MRALDILFWSCILDAFSLTGDVLGGATNQITEVINPWVLPVNCGESQYFVRLIFTFFISDKMASRGRDQSKQTNEKHQAILSRLLKDDDNKYCVDCDAKGKTL